MSSQFDLIVRNGKIVTPEGIRRGELGVVHGRIARVAGAIAEAGASEIDAKGSYVFPGIIDAHVHFNEPGRAEWEGLASGSAALAAGGGTCFFDMPLNSEPPVLNAAALREKRRIAEEQSCVDFALWGGLTPRNLDQLAALRDAGAIGLKAFMCASGIDSFPNVDAKTLREGMKRAAKLGMLVAVHAEDDELAAKFTAEQKVHGRHDAKAYLASRPVEVELTAIRQALELAGETGCALHVVHVSTPEGIELIDAARNQRVDVTAETCPHYLLLNERDVTKLGAVAKCAPPLRSEKRRTALWADVREGRVQTIGSDHSPAPMEMKTSDDFFSVWGGIAGVQHGFELLFSRAMQDGRFEKDLANFSALLARNVARRFRIGHRKGLLAEGYDADFLVLSEDKKAHEITTDELWTRHRITAYAGQKSRARITHTFVRGFPVWANGRLTNLPPPGQFLRPE